MKKILNKMIALLGAAALILGCGIAVSAADPTQGSITIRKYSPLNTGGTPGDGETGPSSAYRPIKGVEYTIYQVALWKYTVGERYDVIIPGLTIDSSTTPQDVYTAVKNNNTGVHRQLITGNNGMAMAIGLNIGLYLVVETDVTNAEYADGQGGKANITKLGEPFLVSVPMTNANGDGYLYDVTVYPKNAATTVKKEADQNVAGVGDQINYTITVDIPQNVSELDKFIVTDTLPTQVDYKSADVAQDSAGQTLVSTSAYTLTAPGTSNPNSLKVEFDTSSADVHNLAGKKVYIIVRATVNASAVSIDEITNKVTVDYGSDTSDIETSVKTYVGKVTIEKVDKDTNAKLNDVQFKIYREVNSQKEYIKDPNDPSKDYLVTTVNGEAVFAGLNNGTYYIEEVKAADGYHLLKKPVEVIIEDDDRAPGLKIQIKNMQKFDLPITGGMGTTLFSVIGGLLIAGGAAGLFIGSRRKNRSEGM